MTILFGNLTTAFTDYGTARLSGTASPEQIAAARDRLFAEVDKDVLILVYIGIGTCKRYNSAVFQGRASRLIEPLNPPRLPLSPFPPTLPTLGAYSRRHLDLHVHLDHVGREHDAPHP